MTTWNIPLQLNNLQAEISHQQVVGLTNPLNQNVQGNGKYIAGLAGNPAGSTAIHLGGGESWLIENTDLTPLFTADNTGITLGTVGSGYTVNAPTITPSTDSSTKVATTAFVQSAVAVTSSAALRTGWLAEGLRERPIEPDHVFAVERLPRIDHDPFDRLPVAQAALVVLPPKLIDLELTDIPTSNGRSALYSGLGNGLDRSASFRVDLRGGGKPPRNVELSFDAWYEIEAGWDFAYVEASVEIGRAHV